MYSQLSGESGQTTSIGHTIEEVESFFKVTQARIKYLSKEQASSEQ